MSRLRTGTSAALTLSRRTASFGRVERRTASGGASVGGSSTDAFCWRGSAAAAAAACGSVAGAHYPHLWDMGGATHRLRARGLSERHHGKTEARTRQGHGLESWTRSLRTYFTSAKLTPQTLPVAQAKSRHTRGLPEHTGRGRYYYYCIYSHLPCCFHTDHNIAIEKNTRSRRFFFANLLFSAFLGPGRPFV